MSLEKIKQKAFEAGRKAADKPFARDKTIEWTCWALIKRNGLVVRATLKNLTPEQMTDVKKSFYKGYDQ